MPIPRFELPLQAAVRVEGVKVLVIRPNVDGAVRTDRRGGVVDPTPRFELPLQAAVRVEGVKVIVL